MGRKKQDPKIKLFGKWHQKVGVVSAVLVAVLAVTGILLNQCTHQRNGGACLTDRYRMQPDAAGLLHDRGKTETLRPASPIGRITQTSQTQSQNRDRHQKIEDQAVE